MYKKLGKVSYWSIQENEFSHWFALMWASQLHCGQFCRATVALSSSAYGNYAFMIMTRAHTAFKHAVTARLIGLMDFNENWFIRLRQLLWLRQAFAREFLCSFAFSIAVCSVWRMDKVPGVAPRVRCRNIYVLASTNVLVFWLIKHFRHIFNID